MKSGRALRRLVIARIEDQVPDLAGKVYDQATATDEHPYCTLGPSDWRPDDGDCIKGKIWSLQIDVWDEGSRKSRVEDLCDEISAALGDFEAEGDFAMHPIGVTLVRVMDDPSGDVHGVVQIEVSLEEA
ncbi:DUF3168 domain-containing protein [Paracoccus sp. SSK6]|uniref:DUF3168 domain-containing protein n=1 Tax=Paracoccus sp. SSK6 TaxID=3143131 RepID=UPI00321A7DF6